MTSAELKNQYDYLQAQIKALQQHLERIADELMAVEYEAKKLASTQHATHEELNA